MGKVKVYELAKEMGITNAELINKLKNMGVEVKSHLSVVEDDIVNKLKGKSASKSSNEKKPQLEKSQMHIIRRNIKVINTDGDKKEVEQITTDISGAIKKSHHTVVNDNNRNEKKGYNKDELGVVSPIKQNRSNKPRFGVRPTNVVITRNGKPIEKKLQMRRKKILLLIIQIRIL